MATVRFSRKPFWLNDDGSVANVVYTPIDVNAEFSVNSFMEKFDHVETMRNAGKTDYSRIIFGDNRIESASDDEFNSFKKNFNRDNVQEPFSLYIANKSPELITTLTQIDPEQTERFMLNKNRNAKTSAFKINMPENPTEHQRNFIHAYNHVVDDNSLYHTEIKRMEDMGDQAYITQRLSHITPMQWAVVLAATGSNPGDFSRIANSYRNLHAANFIKSARRFGIESYVGTNLKQAKTLEIAHKRALENLETAVENQITLLGPGSTEEQKRAIYQQEEVQKETLARVHQNAESDARYIISDLSNKVYDAADKVIRYQAATPRRRAA